MLSAVKLNDVEGVGRKCEEIMCNRESIGLMKKLGGKPFGLSNLLITCEIEKASLEKEYAHLINDNVRLLADEWGVEPEKLISHSLVFRFDVV